MGVENTLIQKIAQEVRLWRCDFIHI